MSHVPVFWGGTVSNVTISDFLVTWGAKGKVSHVTVKNFQLISN